MSILRISLLGPPEVVYNGQLLHLQGDVERKLLFYLAARGGYLNHAVLFPLFWPKAAEAQARFHLQEAVNELSAQLPVPGLLQLSSDLIFLDIEQINIDQLRFQALVNRAGRTPWHIPPGQPLPETVFNLLHKAIFMWRSPHFLAGEAYNDSPGLEDWLGRTRQHLQHLRVALIERLADHLYITGDLHQAVLFTRIALMSDEQNEDLHARLARYLKQMNRPAEASQVLAQLKELQRTNTDLAGKHSRPEAQASLPRSVWQTAPDQLVPFIGREQALANLNRAIEQGQNVLILGPAGVGKTRLLQECTSRLTDPPRFAIWPCRPGENTLPFQSFINLLNAHVQPEEWKTLPTACVAQVGLLLPELSNVYPELQVYLQEHPPHPQPGQARTQLMEAICQLVLHLALDRQLILGLDNAQWADEYSLDTLVYLQRHRSTSQLPGAHEQPERDLILILLGCETEKLLHLQQQLQGNRLFTLRLGGLKPEHIAQLAYQIAGEFPSPDLVSRLQAETEGNPALAVKIIHILAAYQPPPLNLSDSPDESLNRPV